MFTTFNTFAADGYLLGLAFTIGTYDRQPCVAALAVISKEVRFAALRAGDFQRQCAMAALLPALLDLSHAFWTSQWTERVHLSTYWTDG